MVQPLWAVARIDWGRWLNHSPDVATELFNPATRAALTAATPPGALCVVGPDDSGCIDFYFLHKKGFGFNEPGQLAASTYSGKTYLADCVANGARYLYPSDTLGLRDPKLLPYLAHEVKRVGSFRVWALQAAPAPK